MPRLNTTIGNLWVNSVLPEDLRDYDRVLDKKGVSGLMREVALRYPKQYADIARELSRVGLHAATSTGQSFGLKHLAKANAAKKVRETIEKELDSVLSNKRLNAADRDKAILELTGRHSGDLQKAIYQESLTDENPLAGQVLSGSRGNPMNLATLRGMDLLYTDSRGLPIPIPVTRSYSEGLSPAEYWAAAYGARKGVVDVKVAVRNAGYFGKLLNQATHRLVVNGLDSPKPPDTVRGFPIDTDDQDSEGSLLAQPFGGYPRNTVITPHMLSEFKRKGINRILVRSPTVGGPEGGGLFSRDVGIREFGKLPERGANPAMTASQALSEPVSQGSLSSKHSGGVAGASAARAIGGFEWINNLITIPKTFRGGATHASLDGLVQSIVDAPAGGKHIMIDGEKHYVLPGNDVRVKKGDHVEAGDVISDGIPNPAAIVEHKGIGEGRRYFTHAMVDAYRNAGLPAHRRNLELLARGLIDHVRLNQEMGNNLPDDVISYQALEHSYQPRPGARTLTPSESVGKYLERPYLHHSIGTKVRPSMLKDFKEFGVNKVDVHDDPPPFEPEMIRAPDNLKHDPDFLTRMFGSGLKGSFLDSVHRGGTSDPTGTSFIPKLISGYRG